MVVGVLNQTKTVQGHVVGKVGWMEVSVKEATGLVPGFAGYPSSMFVGTERMVVLMGEKGGATCLSVDEDAVEDEADVGSESTDSKRWVVGC